MNNYGPKLSNNEKEFILAALRAEQRIDGRRPFDSRRLSITFSKQDGAVEVQQGQTRVMAVVTGTLGPPFPDRPTEGSLVIFTEFSPMADPSFELGRPGELSVELGRIIDRGLRESRAVDTESLCVLAGRAAWQIRLDIHILDNGGNLVDVANIAALAALSSYRRPDCSIGGHDGQEVIVHPPEVREPVSLILHHLPIAVTFAFFADGELEALDPSVKEEAVMGGRLTVTVNSQGDVCAIQKGGGVGVRSSEIIRCIRIALSKAVEVTNQLKKAVDANALERARRKVKRHPDHKNADFSKNRTDVVSRDVEMNEVGVASANQDERREAVMEILRTEDMDESTSSEEEDDDIPDNLGGKKQEAEIEAKTQVVAGKVRGVKSEGIGKDAPFQGGPSLWDDGVVNGSGTGHKHLDADAMNEFDQVSEAIQKTTMKKEASPDGGPSSLANMAAASVYAQMSTVQPVKDERPLGPVFAQGDLKPVPTSLLDAVKKQKKRKK
ncbi:exosome complex component RRP45 [Marchantia polymorpha subsp. ruderalis]|uniref:Protein ECERIFERUM 7 n=2 Tax=Marchantia polymorpha TaxID=3197 RepID=A0AAF6AL38_MARPO|nr:hypothetical protein MARPO_0005s0264 [Marchantia polymorpha]BBM97158.1 hypothetical protein Mp_1g03430 [Marchantia polymorpha subsp. ruderalis]|eukprot:PTQ48647.1 hypothetical protein MARPO_0005s0264 [Marchantia polymorpha]